MSPVDVYVKNSVETASPLRQIILLYEQAILSLKAVIMDIESGDIKSKSADIAKVGDIIRVLDSALDFERGGKIAQNLHMLYDFIERSLFVVHAKNDIQLAQDLIEILENLKEGWEGIESTL